MFIDATVAAGQIGHLISGDNVRVEAAKTGVCEIFAKADGLVGVNGDLVGLVNHLNENLSVACVVPFKRVSKGQLIARVQIVSDEVEASVLVQISAACKDHKAFQLNAFSPKRVGLVVTTKSNTVEASVTSIQKLLTNKLEALGSEVGRSSVVDHSSNAISVALNAFIPHHGLALVFGATDIENRDDVVPKAVMQVNGVIDHFGMPVEPGNRLLLARIGDMPLIGVPMCVRDKTYSGFDIVLERLLSGVGVCGDDIMAMGVGGLVG